MGGEPRQNSLVDVVAHQNTAGNAAALEQTVDVAHVLLVKNGDHQIVAVAVGDVDGEGDIVVEELRTRDRILILHGGQNNTEKAEDLALLPDKVPRSCIREEMIFTYDALHALAGLFGNVGVAVQDP